MWCEIAGWRVLYFENCIPVHFDHNYAAQTEFGKPLVDSTFTLARVTGQSVTDISQNVSANLGWDEVRLPAPVFEGDTIYFRSEVLEKRGSRSRPDVGIVTVETTGYNQEGVTVITFKRTIMVYRRGHAPMIARITHGGDE
jgi:itaconyl-CoA hydratase